MPAGVTYTIPGAYECDMASTPQGWMLGAICLDAVDDRFVSNMDVDVEWERAKALLLPGATREEWTRAFVELRARLDLMESRSGDVTTVHSTSAEQFSGVAVAGGENPAALWTALDGGRWTASLYVGGESRTLHSGAQVLTGPAVARGVGGGLWCAWVQREPSEDLVHVVDAAGDRRWTFPGRSPSLAANGSVLSICFELPEGGTSHIYSRTVSDGSMSEPVRVSSHHPLNFRPRSIVGEDGEVLVAWDSTPGWGYDIRVDQIRDIGLKRIDLETGRVSDGPGVQASSGALPVPNRTFIRLSGEPPVNMTPSNPRLLRVGDELLCTFRLYQPEDKTPQQWIVDGRVNRDYELVRRREGWYLCVVRWDGSSWSQPARVAEPVGFSHHPYGLALSDGTPTVAYHCFDPGQMPPRSHRVEVLPVEAHLPEIDLGVETAEALPLRPANPATTAPNLDEPPAGFKLVFGDLHNHTSHSSCSPALDGNPPDNIHLQRDVLGYKVLCIADHQRISDADYRCRLDLLEREQVPGLVPIYAIEWNKLPWQHINFYTYDKEVMKQLRQILLTDLDIHLMFNEIVERFPDKVMASRHFHSFASLPGHGPVGDYHTFLYDPRIEWAMEVLHSRGDMLATEEGMFGGPSDFPFPLNFIEWKGARLGFIGGTDHHMAALGACSTGFWVRDLTGESVFEALRNRRTFACASGQMKMWAHSRGVAMGEVGKGTAPVEIEVSVSAPLPIERVSLWSDGAWIEHRSVDSDQVTTAFVDDRVGKGDRYYIVRAQTRQSPDYPKGPIIGYTSPIYLNVG